MSNIKNSITQLIGHTPLLEPVNYEKAEGISARLLVKLELFNPNQSTKDRIALRIIENAEKSGRLKKGMTVVETTSGNTGIGVAGICAAKGYKFRAYIQDQVSVERFKVIKALGGELVKFGDVPEVKEILDKENGDFVAGVNKLKELLRARDDIFFADQCQNPANYEAHEYTTAPEIWEDTKGNVDIVVTSVGTGGTISGLGKFFKEKCKNIKIVAVQPGKDSVPSKEKPHPDEITGVHRFSDSPEKNIPKTLDRSVIDEIIDVDTKYAYDAARKFSRKEGVLLGTSSGAGLYAATLLGRLSENKGKTIVVIAADTGLRYLSTNLYGEE